MTLRQETDQRHPCGCPINAWHIGADLCPRVIVTKGRWKGRVGVVIDGDVMPVDRVTGRPRQPSYLVQLDPRGRAKPRAVKVWHIDSVEVDPQVPDPLVPGSAAWAGVITASKVAAILGLSPYDSPLSCWHKMKGNVPLEQETEDHRRGHYAEPAILAWWADQHAEVTEFTRHPQFRDGHMAATPDAYAIVGSSEALVEAKTARSLDDWGEPGTDEIPAYYLVQVLFQLHLSGIPRAYVPVWGSWFEMAEYVVDYDAELAEAIIAKCDAFWESLQADVAPPLDDSVATFQTLKALHPDIDKGVTVELDQATAVEFIDAKNALDAAKARERLATSSLLDKMGNAQYADHDGIRVGRRQPSNGGGVAIYKVAKTSASLKAQESEA